jgi:hypothetical protein
MWLYGIFRIEFRVHGFQEKMPNPKKVQTIVNMPIPTNPQ